MRMDPRLQIWVEIGNGLFTLGEHLVDAAREKMRRRRWQSYHTVRPGEATPFWNLLSAQLRTELRVRGSKVRLARYLGVPKQRLNDFITGRSRMPDAEITLRLLHWLAEKRAGRDVSL